VTSLEGEQRGQSKGAGDASALYVEVAEFVSLCRGEAQETSQSTMYGGEGCQQRDKLGEYLRRH
jgi:hypothetical protein